MATALQVVRLEQIVLLREQVIRMAAGHVVLQADMALLVTGLALAKVLVSAKLDMVQPDMAVKLDMVQPDMVVKLDMVQPDMAAQQVSANKQVLANKQVSALLA